MSILVKSIPVATCLAFCALSSASSWAQQTAAQCKSVTSVQKRIVQRADQGVESLRGFVRTTDIVYHINMVDVRDSLDAWRAALDCQQRVARAAADVQVVSQADEKQR